MALIKKVRFHEFGGNDVLRVERLEQSGSDARQILVRVRAASVNPVDFKIRSGKYPSVKGDRLPYTPGRDVSGIVEACGAQAARFRPGDAVPSSVAVTPSGLSWMNALLPTCPWGLIMSRRQPSRWQDRRRIKACSGAASSKRVRRS